MSDAIDATSVTAHRLDEGENKDMYAALKAQRLKQLEEKDTTMADSRIYETLAAKGDFPSSSKPTERSLAEPLHGHEHLFTSRINVAGRSEFAAPSSGQTPGKSFRRCGRCARAIASPRSRRRKTPASRPCYGF